MKLITMFMASVHVAVAMRTAVASQWRRETHKPLNNIDNVFADADHVSSFIQADDGLSVHPVGSLSGYLQQQKYEAAAKVAKQAEIAKLNAQIAEVDEKSAVEAAQAEVTDGGPDGDAMMLDLILDSQDNKSSVERIGGDRSSNSQTPPNNEKNTDPKSAFDAEAIRLTKSTPRPRLSKSTRPRFSAFDVFDAEVSRLTSTPRPRFSAFIQPVAPQPDHKRRTSSAQAFSEWCRKRRKTNPSDKHQGVTSGESPKEPEGGEPKIIRPKMSPAVQLRSEGGDTHGATAMMPINNFSAISQIRAACKDLAFAISWVILSVIVLRLMGYSDSVADIVAMFLSFRGLCKLLIMNYTKTFALLVCMLLWYLDQNTLGEMDQNPLT